MIKTKLFKIGTVAAAVTCMAMAGAQSNGPTGFSARLGAFLPTNELARDLGSTWFVFGADYKLNSMSASVPATGMQSYFGISADYYSHGGNYDIPVALTYNMRMNQMVYSVGLGPDFRNSGDLTSTGVGLGGQVAASYEFGNMPTPVFIQAKYFFSSKPELSGFGVYVGVRF